MKAFYFLLVLLAFSASGCSVDKTTGETKFLGVVPVSEEVITTAETVAEEGKNQGGIVGLICGGASIAFAYWRRRKELAANDTAGKMKLVATSVIDGVDTILRKVEETKASGESWTPTKEEVLAILKSAQQSAGTRQDVDAIINEKSSA